MSANQPHQKSRRRIDPLVLSIRYVAAGSEAQSAAITCLILRLPPARDVLSTLGGKLMEESEVVPRENHICFRQELSTQVPLSWSAHEPAQLKDVEEGKVEVLSFALSSSTTWAGGVYVMRQKRAATMAVGPENVGCMGPSTLDPNIDTQAKSSPISVLLSIENRKLDIVSADLFHAGRNYDQGPSRHLERWTNSNSMLLFRPLNELHIGLDVTKCSYGGGTSDFGILSKMGHVSHARYNEVNRRRQEVYKKLPRGCRTENGVPLKPTSSTMLQSQAGRRRPYTHNTSCT
ncbi:hypothetical protein M406DRAFT_75686 [Cryphonectria parasitica EP155]|uniref:Uncharacterized protein n=1 Tax=Cryphonectria parasitica (strain ATCC 38755 / EP155) TaxID=660469 RepID=A0A9P4XSL2_CRYP1|nr:uncharacterized protein M406DRAFT_75686 [Cryphonectria parasitica EP155]KAF3760154.1 hypothetical protein M406DRAFT_75686 [Cryphonectria parasitica EP155]